MLSCGNVINQGKILYHNLSTGGVGYFLSFFGLSLYIPSHTLTEGAYKFSTNWLLHVYPKRISGYMLVKENTHQLDAP